MRGIEILSYSWFSQFILLLIKLSSRPLKFEIGWERCLRLSSSYLLPDSSIWNFTAVQCCGCIHYYIFLITLIITLSLLMILYWFILLVISHLLLHGTHLIILSSARANIRLFRFCRIVLLLLRISLFSLYKFLMFLIQEIAPILRLLSDKSILVYWLTQYLIPSILLLLRLFLHIYWKLRWHWLSEFFIHIIFFIILIGFFIFNFFRYFFLIYIYRLAQWIKPICRKLLVSIIKCNLYFI